MDPREQMDLSCKPGDLLEANDTTIWLIHNGVRVESITTANAIDLYLSRGDIEPVEDENPTIYYPTAGYDFGWKLVYLDGTEVPVRN